MTIQCSTITARRGDTWTAASSHSCRSRRSRTATLRPGTANPGLIRGPGNWSVNLSVTKGFRLSQTVRLDVRMDAFNAFNRVNYSNPNTNITSPDFGRLLTFDVTTHGATGSTLEFLTWLWPRIEVLQISHWAAA